LEYPMADGQKLKALADADLQSSAAGPDGNDLEFEPSGKVRIHRAKLSLRYRSQTHATNL